MVRQRTNRSTRRRLPLRTKNIVRRVSNIDIGVEFKPPLDQPPWTSAPWWSLTLVSNATASSTNFTGQVIHALVLKSLALTEYKSGTNTIKFNLRILTVRIWGLDRQPITLDIYDNSNSGCRKLKQLNDRGSPIHFSCLGWRFGKASYAALNTDCQNDTTSIFTVGQPSGSTKIAVYIQTLIQVQGVPSVTDILAASFEPVADALSNDFAML